jgi:hypothetical protein
MNMFSDTFDTVAHFDDDFACQNIGNPLSVAYVLLNWLRFPTKNDFPDLGFMVLWHHFLSHNRHQAETCAVSGKPNK